MKRILLLLFTITTIKCYSATGNASDGILAIVAVLAFLMVLLAIVSLGGFIRKQIHAARSKRQLPQERFSDGEQSHLSITAMPAV